MALANKRCLILFVREPLSGQVKTRLESSLGPEGTLALYREMLGQKISLLNNTEHCALQLWIDGDCEHADFKHFSGLKFSQQGADIGERMSFALKKALEQYKTAVLIGCDCPDLDAEYLEKAFFTLENDCDLVFGPAFDGGYVLVGMNRHRKEIFKGLTWGSASVMEQSRQRARENDLKWRELEALHDIDEPDDLIYLTNKSMKQYE